MFEVAQILLSKYNVMGQESYKIGVTSQTCPEEKKKKTISVESFTDHKHTIQYT